MAEFHGASSDSGNRMGIKTSIWAETNDPANNRTYVRFRVELYDNNGSLGGYATITGSWSWSGGSGGINQYVDFTGNSGRSYVVVDTGGWIGHDYNYGTASVSGSASTDANSPIGSASAGGSIGLSDYYRGPNSPYYTNITRNSTGDYFTIAYAATGASNSGPGVTYVLERATDAGMSQNYTTISGSHSVNPNTTYYFRMYAYNPDGTVYSGVYGPYYGVPSVPTGLTATPSTSVQNRITLSWTTPSYTGSGITNYYIYRNGAYLGQTGGASTSYIDDTAVRGTTYSYTVAAYNGLGANGTSSSVNGTAPGVPFAATLDSVVASTNTFGKVALSWTAPSTAVGTIQNYYMYAVYNSVIEKTVSTGTNVTSGEITGLDVRKTYTFYVRARNQFSVDSSTPGDVSNSIQRKSPGPPTAPTALTADAPFVPPGTVNLSWTAPSDVGTESGVITGYTVYLAGTSTPILTTTTTATTVTITDLIPATSYTFVVRARNAIADTVGTFSDESNSATATAQGEPDAPTGLTVSADPVVAGRLILTWTPPVGYNTGFRVYDSAGTIIANIATPRYEIDGLLPNTGYSFRVRARNPLTDITGSEGGAISALASGTTGGSSAQTVPSLSVSNTTNATFVGTYNIVGTTATTFTYSKTATNIPFASIPVGGGSTVNNTNTNLNGTYSVTVVGTQATSRELTFSKSGSDIATNTATPSGTMYNNTNVIFNGSYEVAASPAPDSVAKTVSYSKVASNVSSRVASGTVTNNSNATYNGRYSISSVTATQIKYAKTNANIAETLAFGTVYNKTNQDIFNGTFEVIRTPNHKTVEYSTGDLTYGENLITNPSFEYVQAGSTLLRRNGVSNPSFETNVTGWATSNSTISRSSLHAHSGSYSALVSPTSPTGGVSTQNIGTSNTTYRVSIWVYSEAQTTVKLSLHAAGIVSIDATVPEDEWTRLVLPATSTGGSTIHELRINSVGSTQPFFIDSVLFEETSELRPYFDGSTDDALGWDYGWSGTAHASASTAKALSVGGSAAPVGFSSTNSSVTVTAARSHSSTWSAQVLPTVASPFRVGLNGPFVYNRALYVYPDGSALLSNESGLWNGASAYSRLIKLTPSGALDVAFTANSQIHDSNVTSIFVQPDGKILVGGETYMSAGGDAMPMFTRLNANGTVDTTFIDNFRNTAPYDPTFSYGSVSSIAVAPNGKIFISFEYIDVYDPALLIVLNSDGTWASSLNTAIGTGANSSPISKVVIQADNKIIISGDFFAWNSYSFGSQGLIRLNSDGTLDTSFTSNVSGDFDIVRPAKAVVLQPDGKILLGGALVDHATASSRYVARITSAGLIDSSFLSPENTTGDDDVAHLTLQADGKILASGQFDTWGAGNLKHIVRLSDTGVIDSSFSTNIGSGPNGVVYATGVDSFGNILVAGVFASWKSMTAGSIVLLHPDGRVKTSNSDIKCTVSTVSGQVYTASAWVYATAQTSFAMSAAGTVGVDVLASSNTWTRVSVSFTANSSSTVVSIIASSPDVAIYADDMMLQESSTLQDYFDGDTDANAETWPVLYTWSGTPHASTSIREVGATLPTVGAELLEPYGDAQRVQSEAQLQIRYRSGWLG